MHFPRNNKTHSFARYSASVESVAVVSSWRRCGFGDTATRRKPLPSSVCMNSLISSSFRAESGGSSSSGGSSGSSETSSESSFSLNLSSGSDGGSDLSLLTSDVVLERLEKVEKVITVARSTALSVLFASYGNQGNA